MEDEEIRAALRRGDDAAAFRRLAQAYGELVFSRCCRILRDEAAAEDMMQLTLLSAFEHRRQLIGVENIRSWLIVTATRKCFDVRRSRKRADRLERDLTEGSVPEEEQMLDLLAAMEDQRALDECLAALEPRLAAAVLMRYGDNMPWAQVADAVGLPVDTIRMRVNRGALKSLKQCLAAKEVTR